MRFQSLLTLLAVSVAYAAPIAEADAVAVADKAPSYEPAPYSGGKEVNPFDVISDAALTLLKWKLALIKEGAKIILSPFEKAYNDKYHPEPAYPPGYTPKSYPRDAEAEADYSKPAPKYEGPLDVISDAALAILKFKLALIEAGAKIILSPFEKAYNDKYHPAPAYPQPPKSYPRDAEAEADYSKPAPKYEGPLDVISDAALAILKFKLALIEAGAKIILSPFEKAWNDKYHPAPAYPQPPKGYYARDAEADYSPKPVPYKAPKGDELLDGLTEAAIEVLKFKLALIKAGFKIILSPLEQAFKDKYEPTPAPFYGPKASYA